MASTRVKAAALIAAGSGFYWVLEDLSGVWVWLSLTFGSVLLAGGILLLVGSLLPASRRWRAPAINFVVVLTTTGLLLAGLELILPLYESLERQVPAKPHAPTRDVADEVPAPGSDWVVPQVDPAVFELIAARGNPLKMPDAWKQRNVEMPEGFKAYYWHDVLHVRDSNRFRRAEPFPPKRPDTYRVMVVGDSLTYGMGIDEEWRYTSVLEKRLSDDFNIEFLNLGISGWNSTNILDVIETWLPQLEPDLVIYGVCLNDFLPPDVGQEVYATAYALPLSRKVSTAFTQRTYLGAFLADRYDALLRKWDLRMDFFDGILADLEGHQERFARDVSAMNAFVTARGLPAIIGMVLHQQPRYQGRSHRLTRIAEEVMLQAGFSVVLTEDYYRYYHKRNFMVSTWEGHPNEEANQIYASMLEPRVRWQPQLAAYRRQGAASISVPAR